VLLSKNVVLIGAYCLSATLHTRLGLSHPLIFGVSHYICNLPLDPMGIHFLCCTHGGERATLHDVVQDVF
jgi:hypothetical protein